MSRSPRAGYWFVAAALLALGATLGRYGPQWLELGERERRWPDVITQVRELSRLEGVSYHVERVVDLKDQQRTLLGLVVAEDAILLVASGEVVAGVDLARLAQDDIVVAPDGRSVTIRLPPAEVFSARLDSERTYVYNRKTDLLAERQESLETRARQAAEQTLRSAAEEAGILKRAEDSVSRTVKSLVRSLGFETVQVEFHGSA